MLAEELIALAEGSREARPLTESHPGLTPAQGYEAAAALHRHRVAQGWKPVGRKIGFTNRTIWPRYGVYEPIWGTVYDRTLIEASGNAATVRLAGLANPRIEPEVCFGLKGVPASARPEDLLAAIEWAAHSIEIVQSPFPGWKFKLADCTAVNGLHGRLILGTRIPLEALPGLQHALPALEVELLKEDAVVDRGVGANVLDSPLLALGHLVRVTPLTAGEIITTGTVTDAHAVRPGETWSTHLSGLPLPGLTVRFE